jgi:hypothetical protein
MKAVARGKGKIVEHTWNAAQEMHRISTGAVLGPLIKENYPVIPFSAKIHSDGCFFVSDRGNS